MPKRCVADPGITIACRHIRRVVSQAPSDAAADIDPERVKCEGLRSGQKIFIAFDGRCWSSYLLCGLPHEICGLLEYFPGNYFAVYFSGTRVGGIGGRLLGALCCPVEGFFYRPCRNLACK